MKYKVTAPFQGYGYNWPNEGALITPSEETAAVLVEMGVAEPYETRMMHAPKEVKKRSKKESASAPAVRAKTRKTAKRSKKTATK